MAIGLDWITVGTGVLIFLARVADVSLGTIRTISVVHGRTKVAFFLGLIEVSLWLAVITTVLREISARPVLGVFYAFGFSTGAVVGIMIEQRIAFGHTILRIISSLHADALTETIREAGYAVTTFVGEGKTGPVKELFVVSKRKNLPRLLSIAKRIEPDAFYMTEQVGVVSRLYRPTMQAATGWRAVIKKK
jgi:uncharacterized protein YebE (UPF0316 family)